MSTSELNPTKELQAIQIYVFSKLRHDTITTLKALGDINVTLVVEKGEAGMYKTQHKDVNILPLPLNGMGITYAKNYVLSRAKGWVWFIDDDIDGFFLFKDGKRTRISSYGLYGYQCICEGEPNLIMAGLGEFSPKLPKRVQTYNVLCDKVTLLNADYMMALGVKFDEEMRAHSDTDFTLQCLSKGGRVMRSNVFTYHTKRIKTGGMQSKGNVGQDLIGKRYLLKKWGSMFIELVENNNNRLKVNWRHFKHN